MFEASYEPTLRGVAQGLGMERDWLYNVIMLESGFSPNAYNPSGAVGLIQFMPKTLKGMGLVSPALAAQVSVDGSVPETVKQAIRKEFLSKYPSVEAQLLGPVLMYFKAMRPFPTEQSVYMAVFYPKYRGSPLTQEFPANVQAQNPGIDTVGDYVTLVRNKGGGLASKAGFSMLAIAAVGLGAVVLLKSS